MQKTLGGDRLGSGSKMNVNLHGYGRSTHDLGNIWRSSMSAGTLVPFMKILALPGDTFDIQLDCDVKTHPTIGPLFGSYKVQLDTFQIPIRLYNSLMHNNTLNIGNDMSVVKLPQLELRAKVIEQNHPNLDNSQVNASCILHYLGIKGIGMTETQNYRYFNAVPYLMYWDIYKNYYANKQEKLGAVIHSQRPPLNETVDSITANVGGTDYTIFQQPSFNYTPILDIGDTITVLYTGLKPNPDTINIYYSATLSYTLDQFWTEIASATGTYTMEYQGGANRKIGSWDYINTNPPAQNKPAVAVFDLENIDTMRANILAFSSKTTPFLIDGLSPTPYSWVRDEQNGIPNMLSSQEGLGIKTYQSDLLNNWLDTQWIDAINTASAISTIGNVFTIDQLILGRKVYDYLNRIAVTGGSYDDWQDATWSHDRYKRCESPMYEGGLIKELVFQEVVSNSQSEEQPLGTLAGKGVMSKKHKGGNLVIKIDEPSYIIGIVSITPRIDYSQGNDWDINLQTMNDLHKPALDGIGFQDSINERRAWWTTKWDGTNWIQTSNGKLPAWIEYQTAINETHGNFAYIDNEMFMTLNRRYEPLIPSYQIDDLTTYIDPSKFNFIFAETSIDAQNFWVQISKNITARRKMSAKIMPNL